MVFLFLFLLFVLVVVPLFLIFVGTILVSMKVAGWSQQLIKKTNPSAVLKQVTNTTNPLTKAVVKATVVKEAAKQPSKVISLKEAEEEEAQPSERGILEWLLTEEPSKNQGAQPTDAELHAWVNIALKTSPTPPQKGTELLSKKLLEQYRRRKRVE